jgi:hypothetical protein
MYIITVRRITSGELLNIGTDFALQEATELPIPAQADLV